MPATVTVYVVPSVPTGETMAELAPALPPIVTSPATKSLTASLNTTVKSIVAAFVGSAWVVAWLTVTVGWADVVGDAVVKQRGAAPRLPAGSWAAPVATPRSTVPL